mmetsp:Transcript_100656/g.259891  ORF Transcript_100656/g.259891 Transcript_100656/m.259891 type:complete len:268 (+) Transcript_100656:1390-2193(+)
MQAHLRKAGAVKVAREESDWDVQQPEEQRRPSHPPREDGRRRVEDLEGQREEVVADEGHAGDDPRHANTAVRTQHQALPARLLVLLLPRVVSSDHVDALNRLGRRLPSEAAALVARLVPDRRELQLPLLHRSGLPREAGRVAREFLVEILVDDALAPLVVFDVAHLDVAGPALQVARLLLRQLRRREGVVALTLVASCIQGQYAIGLDVDAIGLAQGIQVIELVPVCIADALHRRAERVQVRAQVVQCLGERRREGSRAQHQPALLS